MRFGASSCRFTGAGTSFLRTPLADPFECAGAAFGGWPFSSGLLGLPSQRLGGSRLMPLALEGMDNRLGALGRGLVRVAAMTLVVSFSEVFPLAGGGRSIPALRAFESPMAIACFADRAPCLPLRTCSISSRTNSPAWVVGAFPSRLSLRARSKVLCSGMMTSLGATKAVAMATAYFCW